MAARACKTLRGGELPAVLPILKDVGGKRDRRSVPQFIQGNLMLLVFENSNPNFLRACLYKTQGHVERDEPYAYLSKPNLPGALDAITEESQKIVDESVAKWLAPDPADGRSSSTSGAYRRRMQAARKQAALILVEAR